MRTCPFKDYIQRSYTNIIQIIKILKNGLLSTGILFLILYRLWIRNHEFNFFAYSILQLPFSLNVPSNMELWSVHHFLTFPVARICCYKDGTMTHILTRLPLSLFSVTPHPPQPLTVAVDQNGGRGGGRREQQWNRPEFFFKTVSCCEIHLVRCDQLFGLGIWKEKERSLK